MGSFTHCRQMREARFETVHALKLILRFAQALFASRPMEDCGSDRLDRAWEVSLGPDRQATGMVAPRDRGSEGKVRGQPEHSSGNTPTSIRLSD